MCFVVLCPFMLCGVHDLQYNSFVTMLTHAKGEVKHTAMWSRNGRPVRYLFGLWSKSEIPSSLLSPLLGTWARNSKTVRCNDLFFSMAFKPGPFDGGLLETHSSCPSLQPSNLTPTQELRVPINNNCGEWTSQTSTTPSAMALCSHQIVDH